MTILAAYEVDEYAPEYGTFLIRDSYDNFTGETDAGISLLDESGTDAQPCGTIGRGGSGWLDGPARGFFEHVRLESHDSAPDRDDAEWDTVVETPFRSVTGAVGLSRVTSGSAESAQLVLARAGYLRVRICCRANTEAVQDEHRWLVQFWPAPVVPPRWLKRSESPLAPDLAIPITPYADQTRCCSFASDIAFLVLWSDTSTFDIDQMADELLASVDDIREALAYAARDGLLTVVGDLLTDGTLELTVNARRDNEFEGGWMVEPLAAPQPTAFLAPDAAHSLPPALDDHVGLLNPGGPTDDYLDRTPSAGSTGHLFTARMNRAEWNPAPSIELSLLPVGPPCRAGYLDVAREPTLWLDAEPFPVPEISGRSIIQRALQTKFGTVIFGQQAALLLARSERKLFLQGLSFIPAEARLDETGRHLVVPTYKFGRHPRDSLTVVDLSDLSSRTVEVAVDGDYQLIGLWQGQIYFSCGVWPIEEVFTWTAETSPPGALGYIERLDPVTGTTVRRDSSGRYLLRSDGTRRPHHAEAATLLEPGGELVYTFPFTAYGETQQLAFLDPEVEDGDPTVVVLPSGAETSRYASGRTVWEDRDHLLFSCSGPSSRLDGPEVVRLDVRTGDLEQVMTPSTGFGHVVLVEPLLG